MRPPHTRPRLKSLLTAGVIGAAATGAVLTVPVATASAATPKSVTLVPSATTPIKHVVVIFGENISFDHYFGTYPNATNSDGVPFTALPGTPSVNGLSGSLLTANPNGVNPRRYDPAAIDDVLTCSMNHSYKPEQQSFDNGAMDKFPQFVGTKSTTNTDSGHPCTVNDQNNGNGLNGTTVGTTVDGGEVMNYYDGNTVQGEWNYAQHYAMSDNSFDTNFGPSSVGALNLVSGNTGGVLTSPFKGTALASNTALQADGLGQYSVIGDPAPYYDDCYTNSSSNAVTLGGQNIGDLLNAQGLSWGFFQGGFKATTAATNTSTQSGFDPAATGHAVCATTHAIGSNLAAPNGPGTGTTGAHPYGNKIDYIPHHEPFQYYPSTANPHHLPPASLAAIGTDTETTTGGVAQFDTANHNYDTSDFDALVSAINGGNTSLHLPNVSFLKAPGYEDGHAQYSDPIDEQAFDVAEINSIMQTPDWSSTAIIINYDDSDGWYDHVYSGVTNPSTSSSDALTGTGACSTAASGTTPLANEQGRCGYSSRLPMIVISPYAKANFVDHTQTSQASITKFIEDNWNLGRISGSFDAPTGAINNMFDFSNNGANAATFENPASGAVVAAPPANLPEAGSSALLLLAGLGAAALVVTGGGTTVLTRRRRRARA